MTDVAGVVLAAGAATRYGGAKQLAVHAGRPLVAHAVDVLLRAGIDDVVVVLGAEAEAVEAAIPTDARVRSVLNRKYREGGQSSSLRAALVALEAGSARVAVVVLADQPLVAESSVTVVVRAVRQGAPVARVVHDDGPSHPVGLARQVWARVAALEGDEGARQLFDVLDVTELRVAGPRPIDVDIPTDLFRLTRPRGPWSTTEQP